MNNCIDFNESGNYLRNRLLAGTSGTMLQTAEEANTENVRNRIKSMGALEQEIPIKSVENYLIGCRTPFALKWCLRAG